MVAFLRPTLGKLESLVFDAGDAIVIDLLSFRADCCGNYIIQH